MFSKINLNQIVVMIVPLLFSAAIHEVAHGYIALRMEAKFLPCVCLRY